MHFSYMSSCDKIAMKIIMTHCNEQSQETNLIYLQTGSNYFGLIVMQPFKLVKSFLCITAEQTIMVCILLGNCGLLLSLEQIVVTNQTLFAKTK